MSKKLPKDVVAYIKSQYWYDNFKNNMTSKSAAYSGRRNVTSGKLGAYTLEAAFNWAETEQGEAYWKEANKNFKEWYYG